MAREVAANAAMIGICLRVAAGAALLASLAACSADSPVAPVEVIFKVDALSAVELTGPVGSIATPAPLVRVTDSEGRPFAGVDVMFTIAAGDGRVIPSHVLTDADGRATVTWYLGTALTIQTLKASAGTLAPVEFNATTVAGPLAILERTAGEVQTAAIGSTLTVPLQARVLDSYRNPLKGVTVTFTVASGGGTIDPSDRVSDSAGYVTAGTWTLGPLEGVQTVRAQAGTLSAIFSADTYDCSSATGETPCVGLGELVFSRYSDRQLYRMRIDGKGLTKLTTTGDNYNAVWSADGRRIAFIRYTPATSNNGAATQEVFVMNADGSNLVQRGSIGGYVSVAWSPDGQKLAVSSYDAPSDHSNIYITSAVDDVTTQSLLVVDGAEPSWSPDGSQIAYVHGTGYYDVASIYVVNADGTNAHSISPQGLWSRSPRWSPDGKKIAFIQCYQGCGAYTMLADGSGQKVAAGDVNPDEVSWSPNGKWLSFSAWSNSTPSVWYVPVEGTGAPRRVINDAWHVDWRPTPR